ncbi:MAG: GNAT family N-acetyltransferase [Nanoarchaeota archaeon]
MIRISMLSESNYIGCIEVYYLDKEPHITGTYVLEQHRSQGHAKELYKKVFKILGMMGHKHVYSDTIITSEFVHNIWRSYKAEWVGGKYKLGL